MKRLLPALLLAVLAPLPAAAAPTRPCAADTFRQFDFWLGTWKVHTPDSKLAGVNQIQSEYGGCVLHERYDTGKGYAGESLNTYDPGSKRWHQTWVDNQGALLLLDGGLRGASMVLEGETRDAAGVVTRHRITWTPNPDGSVRQHWESASTGGTWSTAFDGKYTRK